MTSNQTKQIFKRWIEQGGARKFAGVVGQFAKCGQHCSQSVIRFKGTSSESVHYAFAVANVIARCSADRVPETLCEFEIVR